MTTSGAVLLRSGTAAPPVTSLGTDDKLFYVRSGVLYYRGQDGVEHAAVGVDPATTLTAGLGLSGGGDLSANRTFDVNVDGATLEINADTLRVKAAGIGTNEIADGSVANADLANMAQALLKGRAAAAGTGPPQDLTPAQGRTVLGLGTAALNNTGDFDAAGLAAAAQAASQPVDADLTTIAGLTATTDRFMQAKASAWTTRTPTQVTADLDVAVNGGFGAGTKGLMSAADKFGLDNDNVSVVNILDYNGDRTATADIATPLANALAALPATGGVIGFPIGNYILGSNFNPAGRSVRLVGDNKAQTNLIFTHASTDGITFDSGWYSGIENMQIAGLSTQTTGVLAGGETTVPVAELKNFPTSGSASLGGTAGWVTMSWTGKSVASGAGNLTGCSGVTAAASGVWVQIRTGGYMIRLESNYCNLQNVNVSACFDGILFKSALGFLDTVEVRQVRDNAIDIDAALADKFINRLTTASSPLMEKSINILRTSSLLMTQCQILNGKIGLDFNPPNGATIPSVEVLNTFFDNCTIGMRVTATGTGSSYRSKFTNCWYSSASTAGIQFNTTQFDGFSFVNCDFYGNGKGIDASIVGGGHWMVANSRFAQNTTGIHLAGSAAHFPMIVNNEIGPTGAFTANTTGITVVAGTYKGLIISGNAVINNTTNATLGAVTIGGGAAEASWYQIIDNAGINPLTGAAVTTPAIPASTVVATNQTGRRVQVVVKNGTTAPTLFTFNGVVQTGFVVTTVTTGLNVFILNPGGTLAFTYTVAPTWLWTGL